MDRDIGGVETEWDGDDWIAGDCLIKKKLRLGLCWEVEGGEGDVPAGVVVNPGAGRTSASRLNCFRAASIPRVRPRSWSAANEAKNEALRPVVASDSMSLGTCEEDGWRTREVVCLTGSGLRTLLVLLQLGWHYRMRSSPIGHKNMCVYSLRR